MFAAASGARLAHRHNQATIKKQLCTNNIDGLHAHYKTFEKNHHAKYSDTPSIHGQRKPQKCYHNYTSKLYSSDSESVSKLSSSYIDLHGKIPKFGHVDFECLSMQAALFIREKQELRKKKLKIRRGRYELPSHVATKDIAPFPRYPPNSWGKAAWQDRELGYNIDRRESVCVTNEAATHRFKQREAHKRWVKRNRIHDATFGDCSSEDEDVYGAYGVQSTAANALLYIGLGTMCIGMIIAFVGTGEKGFKTIELRLIGPSLIGAGVMITILRVMLCVCPSKCLKFNRHKLKNSTNKLNSEDECNDNAWKDGIECVKDGNSLPKPETSEALPMKDRTSMVKKSDSKKRVSIVEMPTTSSTCEKGAGVAALVPHLIPVQEMIFTRGKMSPVTEQVPTTEKPYDLSSVGSDISVPSHITRTEGERKDSSIPSDISLSSQLNGFLDSDSFDSEMSSKTVKNASKFESQRSPKNVKSEILLNPSNLSEYHDSD